MTLCLFVLFYLFHVAVIYKTRYRWPVLGGLMHARYGSQQYLFALFDDFTLQALAGIADLAAKYDSDGVDVYFLNNARFAMDVTVSIHFTRYISTDSLGYRMGETSNSYSTLFIQTVREQES